METNNIRIILFFNILISYINLLAFDNLQELNSYASKYPELVSADNNNLYFPNFGSTYKKMYPSLFDNFLNFFKIKKLNWTSESFQELLVSVTKQREKDSSDNPTVIKITPKNDLNLVIWSDLEGAFHSFVRDLSQLKNLNIINDNLTIIKDNYFFIINGNVLARSPYILETLTAILSLMKKNPEQIFFIKGEYEEFNNWLNFGLREELINKTQTLNFSNNIPFQNEINNFLKTLPSAIFIATEKQNGSTKFIRISNYGRDYEPLDESLYTKFLSEKTNKDLIQKFVISEKKTSEEIIDIKAIIKNKKREFSFQFTDGLQILFPDKGSIAWAIFSAPTFSNQKLYKFFNDAFAILKINPEKDPFITLYKQHCVEKNGFETKKYNLFSEEIIDESKEISSKETKITSHTTKKEFCIGTILDLSGITQDTGQQLLRGLNLRINKENLSGGINGQQIKLITLDSEYKEEIYIKQLQKLLEEYKTNLTICNLGTQLLDKALPFIEKNNIAVLFPYTGSDEFRKKDLKNVINLKSSYSLEVEALIDYMVKNTEYDKIIIFYQNDLYGISLLQAAKKILSQKNIKFTEISYKTDLSNIEKQAQVIKKINPSTIFLFAIPAGVKPLIENLGAKFFLNKDIFINSILSDAKFIDYLKKLGINFINTQEVPDLNKKDVEITREYLEDASKEKLSENSISFQAYIAASILIDTLKKIDGDITKEKILTQIEKIQNLKFKDLELNFEPETRQILNNVWIGNNKGETLLYKSKKEDLIKTEKPKKITTAPEKTSAMGGNEIKIGSTLDLSSESSSITKDLLLGIQLVFSQVNKRGGINNKKIKFICLDDKFQDSLAEQNIKDLLSQDIDLIFSPTNSYTLEKYLYLVQEKKTLVIFPRAISPIFRVPSLEYMVHYISSSKEEGSALADYFITQRNIKKIAILYQDDPYGKGALEGATEVFKKHNLKENINWIATYHERNSINVKSAVETIQNFDPQIIMLFSVPYSMEAFIEKMGLEKLYNKTLVSISGGSGSKFLQFLQNRNLKNYVYSKSIPNENNNDFEIVREYKNNAKKANIPLSSPSLEGYISASIFVDVLSKIEGEITKEAILKEFTKIKNYDFKGIQLNFNPITRELSDNIWIHLENEETLLYKNKPEEKPKEIAAIRKDITLKPEEPITEKKVLEDRAPKQKIEKITESSTEPSKESLNFATTLDLSARNGDMNKGVLSGIELSIKKANAAGGINGRKINLTALDDEYDPEKGRANVLSFIKKGINILLSPGGSYVIDKYMDLVKDKKIFIAFPNANAPSLRNPDYTHIVHFCASSYEEGRVMIDYILNKTSLKKFFILYQKEPFSQGAFDGARNIFEKNNLKENIDWLAVSHFPNIYNIKEIITKMQNFNPQVILLMSISLVNKHFLENVEPSVIQNKKIFVLESTTEIEDYIQKNNIKANYVHILPNMEKSKLEIIDDYKKAAKQFGIKAVSFGLEGYVAAELFWEILKKIDGDVTIDKIIKQIEQIKDYKFKGLDLNFNPKSKSIINSVWLILENGETISYQIKESTEDKPKAKKEEPKEFEFKKEVTPKSEEPEIEKTKSKLSKKTVINLGTTIDLSSEFGDTGKNLLSGLDLGVKKENATDGINGQKINLTALDDEYDPEKAKNNILALMKKGINIFLAPLSSYTLESYFNLVEDKKIFVAFPDANSTVYRKPEFKNVVHFIPSSYQEGRVLADYLINKTNSPKILIIYQNDPFCIGALNGAREILEKHLLKEDLDWFTLSHLPKNYNIQSIIDKIKTLQPQVIMFFDTPAVYKGFIEKIEPQEIINKKLVMIEPSTSFLDFIKRQNIKITYTTTIPNIEKSDLEIVREYKQSAEDFGVKAQFFGLEGYIVSRLFFDILKKIDGEISVEKIIEQIEKIKNYNFRDLNLNFDPKTRELSNIVWLTTENEETIPYEIKETASEKPESESEKKEPEKIIQTMKEKLSEEKNFKQKIDRETTQNLNEINLGTTLDLSSEYSQECKHILSGIELSIKKENAAGGINGKKINLTALDDEYDPEKAKNNVLSLIKKGINIFLATYGSYPLEEYFYLVKEKKILLAFPEVASPIFRKPEFTNVIHFFPSSYKEGKTFADYLLKEKPVKKILIIYQEDPYGIGGFNGIKETLEKNNLKEKVDWFTISHTPKNYNITDIINKIKDLQPQAIIIFSISILVKKIVQEIDPKELLNKKLLISQPSAEIVKILDEQKIKTISTYATPNLENTDIDIVKEYKQTAEKFDTKIEMFGLEGYMISSLFFDILKKIDGEITIEKIIEESEKIKNTVFRGLNLNFDSQTRELSNTIWLTLEDGKTIPYQVQDIPTPETKKPKKLKVDVAQKSSEETTVKKEFNQEKIITPETKKDIKSDKEIKIATLLDLSAELSDIGKPYLEGLTLCINQQNKKGGINGQKIELTAMDTKYNKKETELAIQKLLKSNIDIIVGANGSYSLKEALPFIKQNSIVSFFANANAPIFYTSKIKNIVNLFPSSFEEGKTITKYLLSKHKDSQKIVLLYQKEPYSKGAYLGAKKILEKNGLKENIDWIAVSHSAKAMGKMNIAVKQTQKFKPDAAILLSLQIPTQTFISSLGESLAGIKKFFAIGSYSNPSFRKFMQRRNVFFASLKSVPDPQTSNLEIVKEYKAATKVKNYNINEFSLEAYITASVFIDILKKVDGNITKEKIIEQTEKIKNYDFKGLYLNFNPKTRCLGSTFWIDEGQKEFIEYKI